MNLVPHLANPTDLPEKSIKNTDEFLDQDCTVPFISRYRKEKTGHLDEIQIGDIVKFEVEFEALEKRGFYKGQNRKSR